MVAFVPPPPPPPLPAWVRRALAPILAVVLSVAVLPRDASGACPGGTGVVLRDRFAGVNVDAGTQANDQDQPDAAFYPAQPGPTDATRLVTVWHDPAGGGRIWLRLLDGCATDPGGDMATELLLAEPSTLPLDRPVGHPFGPKVAVMALPDGTSAVVVVYEDIDDGTVPSVALRAQVLLPQADCGGGKTVCRCWGGTCLGAYWPSGASIPLVTVGPVSVDDDEDGSLLGTTDCRATGSATPCVVRAFDVAPLPGASGPEYRFAIGWSQGLGTSDPGRWTLLQAFAVRPALATLVGLPDAPRRVELPAPGLGNPEDTLESGPTLTYLPGTSPGLIAMAWHENVPAVQSDVAVAVHDVADLDAAGWAASATTSVVGLAATESAPFDCTVSEWDPSLAIAGAGDPSGGGPSLIVLTWDANAMQCGWESPEGDGEDVYLYVLAYANDTVSFLGAPPVHGRENDGYHLYLDTTPLTYLLYQGAPIVAGREDSFVVGWHHVGYDLTASDPQTSPYVDQIWHQQFRLTPLGIDVGLYAALPLGTPQVDQHEAAFAAVPMAAMSEAPGYGQSQFVAVWQTGDESGDDAGQGGEVDLAVVCGDNEHCGCELTYTECSQVGAHACGDVDVGCGATQDCGACPNGEDCGMNGVPGSCECLPGAPCSDGNSVTVDSCGPGGLCAHVPVALGEPCEDDNPCTTDDLVTQAGCVGTPRPAGTPCDDGSSCTTDDSCASGQCVGVAVADGVGCDDDLPCSLFDTCEAGVCVGSLLLPGSPCDDESECTTADTCHAGGRCAGQVLGEGSACDDGSICSVNGQCHFGECQSEPRDCDDADPCTQDGCDLEAEGGCYHLVPTGACDDGDACTTGETWSCAQCVGGTPVACEDDNPCTSDGCDPASGCTNEPNTAACDDGNPCTESDACSGGACVGNPLTGTACDDGKVCTAADACDDGVCVGTPGDFDELPCDDANPCTEEQCWPDGWCHQVELITPDACHDCVGDLLADGTPCDDANGCTVLDVCRQGACAGSPLPDDMPCTNGDTCTTGGQCQAGLCLGTQRPDGTFCDDGNDCTADDACDAGVCVGDDLGHDGEFPLPPCESDIPCTVGDGCWEGECHLDVALDGSPCDDGNPCTATDQCQAATCSGSPIAAGSPCEDGDPCTTDMCDGLGTCVHTRPYGPCQDCTTGALLGAGAPCDDGNACTDADECAPDGTCAGYPSPLRVCDDGDPCSIYDSCHQGACVGLPLPCDDANPCTTDTCDPLVGCTFAFATGPCDDGNPCSESDTCVEGICAGTPGTPGTACEDGNPCTASACDGSGTCVPVGFVTPEPCRDCAGATLPDGALCDDGNRCTFGDVCQDGLCVAAAQPEGSSCDPGDSCVASATCVDSTCLGTARPDGAGCDDRNACTAGDECASGVCGGSPLTNVACDDGNPCTVNDTCNAGTCVGGPVVDSTRCDDGNLCTERDLCHGGVCAGAPVRSATPCDDGNPCTDNDVCVATACLGSLPELEPPCDDGDPCTAQDTCDSGRCAGSPVAPGAPPCETNLPCVGDDCAGVTGAYVYPEPSPEDATAADELATREQSLREFLLDAARDPTAELDLGWDEVASLRSMYGDGVEIPPDTIGCDADPYETATCFLESLPDAFGNGVDAEHLELVRVVDLPNGWQSVILAQYLEGLPVFGGRVSVTMDEDGDITGLFSRAAADLDVQRGGYPSMEALFADTDWDVVFAEARALGIDGTLTEEQAFVYPSPDRRTGIPVVQVTVNRGGPEDLQVIVDVRTGAVLHSQPRNPSLDIQIRTFAKYPEVSDVACSTTCASGVCATALEPDLCVTPCTPETAATVCAGFASECCDPPDNFPEFDSLCCGQTAETVYEEWAFTSAEYQRYGHFQTVKIVTETLDAYYWSVLGRNGWDRNGAPYLTFLTAFREGIGRALGNAVLIYSWRAVDPLAAPGDWKSATNLLGHEWGHNLSRIDSGGDPNRDKCLREDLAGMQAELFKAHSLRNEPNFFPWNYDDSGLRPTDRNPFAPFAMRSHFDAAPCPDTGTIELPTACTPLTARSDCPPYFACVGQTCTNLPQEHNSQNIWARFVVVLSEGVQVLQRENSGEDVGASRLQGIGVEAASRVVDFAIATQHTGPTARIEDLLDGLVEGGYAYGVGQSVRDALGVVGFVMGGKRIWPDDPTPGYTDRAPDAALFSAWSGTPVRWFWAWKESAGRRIKILRYVGAQATTDTIEANTDSAPALVEYKQRLYVFWVDRTEGSVKYLWYNASSNRSGIYDLGTKGLRATAGLGAAVLDGRLALVYAARSTLGSNGWGEVRLAWCRPASGQGCTTAGWHAFGYRPDGTAVFSKSLGFQAFPGLGVAAGKGLNGDATPELPRLYVVSAARANVGPQYRIRVDQVTPAGTVVHTEWIHSSYPSYQTASEVGVQLSLSAFAERPPQTEPRRYLYLAWQDRNSDRLYKAVVQTFANSQPVNSWITRSDDTFIRTRTGVRILPWRGIGEDWTGYYFGDTAGRMVLAGMTGRY